MWSGLAVGGGGGGGGGVHGRPFQPTGYILNHRLKLLMTDNCDSVLLLISYMKPLQLR